MSENVFLGVLFFIGCAIVITVVWFAVDSSIENAKFGAVCQYAGGKVDGDLCVKGDTVILRQDNYLD